MGHGRRREPHDASSVRKLRPARDDCAGRLRKGRRRDVLGGDGRNRVRRRRDDERREHARQRKDERSVHEAVERRELYEIQGEKFDVRPVRRGRPRNRSANRNARRRRRGRKRLVEMGGRVRRPAETTGRRLRNKIRDTRTRRKMVQRVVRRRTTRRELLGFVLVLSEVRNGNRLESGRKDERTVLRRMERQVVRKMVFGRLQPFARQFADVPKRERGVPRLPFLRLLRGNRGGRSQAIRT